MSNARARERAKRRYAKRQSSLAARAARRRRNQQVAAAVVTMLVVVVAILALSRMARDQLVAAGSTPSSTGTASARPTATGKATPNPCPAPTSKPVSRAPSYPAPPPKSLAQGKVWDATLVTTCGTIGLELYGDKAPQTVSSFIFLSRKGFYAGSPCHRLTSDPTLKVLQCGDPTGTGSGGPGYSYGVENAPANGAYPAGTLAMARGSSTTSNGSQFFLTYGDSTLPTQGGGYSIFGKVTKGLDVLRTVAAGGTTNGGSDGAPARAISIRSISVTPR